MKKIQTKDGQVQRAMERVERERAESGSAKMQAGVSIVGSILGALFSRKKMSSTNVSRGKSAMSSASRAMKQRQDVKIAEMKVEDLERERDTLEHELLEDIAQLEERYAPEMLELENETIKPYKKDIDIKYVGVLWLPFDDRGNSAY